MNVKSLNNQMLTGTIIGVGASVVPSSIIRRAIAAIVRKMHIKHPGLQDRLSSLAGRSFLFVILDMPFNILMHIDNGIMNCEVADKHSELPSDVTIQAASHKLTALLAGEEDGDALFFSRDLEVEGNTEAMLILRNALDSEDIDIEDIAYSVLGPFSGFARRIGQPLRRLSHKIIDDINHINHALALPVMRRQDEAAIRMEELEKRLAAAESLIARKTAKKS